MLGLNTTSLNEVSVIGPISKKDFRTGITSDKKEYVAGTITVRVEQEVNGINCVSEIPISLYANKYKAGTNEISKNYENILAYRDNYKSMADCKEDEQHLATIVSVSPKYTTIGENLFASRDGKVVSDFSIRANYVNEVTGNNKNDESYAKFEVVGTIVKMIKPEVPEGEPEKLNIELAIVKFGEKVEKLSLVAYSPMAITYMTENYYVGDTVKLNGVIVVSQTVSVREESTGFGEPIKRSRTVTRKELVITSGCEAGFDEDHAYNSDAIKSGLEVRKQLEQEKISKASASTPTKGSVSFNPGF